MFDIMKSQPGILAYHSLFTPVAPKQNPSADPKYQALLLFTEKNMASPEGKNLKLAIDMAATEKFGSDYEVMGIHSPIRTDVTGKGYPSDTVAFVRFSTTQKPIVVGPDALPIMDEREIYSGILARVSFRPFAYGGKGSSWRPGVSFGLENFQKLENGPRMTWAKGDGSEFDRWD